MTTRNRTFLTLAVVAIACIAMTTTANAGVITQTDAIGFPSVIGPIANDDLLQSSLTSVTATNPQWGTAAGLADGAGDAVDDKFGYSSAATYSPGNNKAGVYTAVFVLDDHFDIGEIRVTAGSADGLRSDQDWDVYTSSDSGSTWVALRMDNILLDGPLGHGKGTTITLTDDTGTLASNVNAIKFDIFAAGGGTSWHANYQEIDVVGAPPAPDVDATDYIALKTHMGQATSAGATEGDFNGDEIVDWDDLQILQDRFRELNAANANPVPEPATLLIMMGAGLPALLKRRRSRS